MVLFSCRLVLGFAFCLLNLAPFPVLAWSIFSPPIVDEVVLVPHTAVYDMFLASAQSSSGIVGASGAMRYSLADQEDGWTVETRAELEIALSEGDVVSDIWDFVSWESKDGQYYRFRVHHIRAEELLDSFYGEARIVRNDEGEAIFHRPDGDDITVVLPRGTLFPAGHTMAVVRQARKGSRIFPAFVFDGSAIQGPSDVSAVIANRYAPPEGVISPLLERPSWFIGLAFYAPEDTGSIPRFEVWSDYRDNGVSGSVLQGFGGFSLRGTLRCLEEEPKGRC